MSNVYYQLYRSSVLAFTRTLVIKSTGVAETLNRELGALGIPVNEARPETWKYYMNIAGYYHQVDRPMVVRSLDTLEDIEFTRENLRLHRATAREYRPGGTYYKALTLEYPRQVPLIQGILNPVDIDAAIEAEDGTLLYFDETYIESNEQSLVRDLQYWLSAFFARWHNTQYELVDDLYLPGFLGTLYGQLPLVIDLLRLKRAKTNEAHSFHIREYLGSNGRLDVYLPYLNKEQQLFLYRNLLYLNRNVGRQATFDTLVSKILTLRGIPLNWYKLEHNIESLPEHVYPEVDVVKYPVNDIGFDEGPAGVSVHTILKKQRRVARDNRNVEFDAERETTATVKSGAFNQLPTKVLESEMIDRSNSSIRSLVSVLLNQWVYLSTQDRYRAYTTIAHPKSGELINLSARDAFIVAFYAFHRSRDIPMENVPRVLAYQVLRPKLPDFNELRSIVDTRWVPERLITGIMDRITPLGEYITIERFNNACVNLHEETLALWELYSFQPRSYTRGMAEQLVRRHYQHAWCDLVDEPTRYTDWFKTHGIDLTDMTGVDYNQLYVDCVNNATGLNLVNKVTIGEIQRAMLELMGQMSSYSVQYLRTINDTDFRYISTPAIRLGEFGRHDGINHRVNSAPNDVSHLHGSHSTHYSIEHDQYDAPIGVKVHTTRGYRIPADVGVRLLPTTLNHIKLGVDQVGVRSWSLDVENPFPDSGRVN